jgi:hypothetical protein
MAEWMTTTRGSENSPGNAPTVQVGELLSLRSDQEVSVHLREADGQVVVDVAIFPPESTQVSELLTLSLAEARYIGLLLYTAADGDTGTEDAGAEDGDE